MRQRNVLIAGIVVSLILSLGACSRTQPPDDKKITDEIQSKLFQDDTLKKEDISVNAQNGVVTLTGHVATEDAKASAEHLAGSADGVKQVVNQLAIAAPEAASTGSQGSAAPAAQAPVAAPPPPPVEKPKPIVVPAGTTLTVRVGQALGSKTSQAGQTFLATVAQPVSVGGRTAIPAGSTVSGTVVSAKAKGKVKGEGELSLALTGITVKEHTYPIQTSVLSSTSKGKGKRTAATTGGGAAGGALIGGIAGGGKGAAIGAVVGAGAGFIGGAATGNKQIEIPVESVLSFQLSEPLTLPR